MISKTLMVREPCLWGGAGSCPCLWPAAPMPTLVLVPVARPSHAHTRARARSLVSATCALPDVARISAAGVGARRAWAHIATLKPEPRHVFREFPNLNLVRKKVLDSNSNRIEQCFSLFEFAGIAWWNSQDCFRVGGVIRRSNTGQIVLYADIPGWPYIHNLRRSTWSKLAALRMKLQIPCLSLCLA